MKFRIVVMYCGIRDFDGSTAQPRPFKLCYELLRRLYRSAQAEFRAKATTSGAGDVSSGPRLQRRSVIRSIAMHPTPALLKELESDGPVVGELGDGKGAGHMFCSRPWRSRRIGRVGVQYGVMRCLSTCFLFARNESESHAG